MCSELCDLHKWIGLKLGIYNKICILKLEGNSEGKRTFLKHNEHNAFTCIFRGVGSAKARQRFKSLLCYFFPFVTPGKLTFLSSGFLMYNMGRENLPMQGLFVKCKRNSLKSMEYCIYYMNVNFCIPLIIYNIEGRDWVLSLKMRFGQI